MSHAAKSIDLPQDLKAPAEERVHAGQCASGAAVVCDALEEKQLAVLRQALDIGIAQLDAGLGVETSPDELMAEISADIGLEP